MMEEDVIGRTYSTQCREDEFLQDFDRGTSMQDSTRKT
jgi:hypothetical protein